MRISEYDWDQLLFAARAHCLGNGRISVDPTTAANLVLDLADARGTIAKLQADQDQALDDLLLLLATQHYPTPEKTYKHDGGWSLALSDLRRCVSKLATERDAAGEQLRGMREALVLINETMPKGYERRITKLSNAALAFTPTAAEAKAAENTEKAAKWDDWCDEFHTHYKLRADDPDYMIGVVNADEDRRIARMAELEAELAELRKALEPQPWPPPKEMRAAQAYCPHIEGYKLVYRCKDEDWKSLNEDEGPFTYYLHLPPAPVVKDSLTTETTLAEETGCCTFEPSFPPIDREVMRIGKTLFRELSEKAALLDKLVKAPLPAAGDDTAKYHLDWFLGSAGWYRYTDPDDMQIKLAKRCKEAVRESK